MAAAQKPTSGIKWATPELEAHWRRVAAKIEANQAKEQELQRRAQSHGASISLDPNSIALIRFAALLDLLWPPGTAEGQEMRLRHDDLVQDQIAKSLEGLSAQLGQQLLAMGAMLPPDQLAALQHQVPPGLVNGGPERRSRNQQRRGR